MREQLLEFGLAEQQRLQQRMRTELEVRQHAQLFERGDGKVLRLVDDQQAAAAGARFFVQETLDRAQRGGLVVPVDDQAERVRDDVDDLLAVELAGHDLRRGEARRIDRRHEVRDERRLARADLAGDDHEALALREAIAEVGQRLAVRLALEIECGVGCELEGSSLKPVEVVEHWCFPLP